MSNQSNSKEVLQFMILRPTLANYKSFYNEKSETSEIRRSQMAKSNFELCGKRIVILALGLSLFIPFFIFDHDGLVAISMMYNFSMPLIYPVLVVIIVDSIKNKWWIKKGNWDHFHKIAEFADFGFRWLLILSMIFGTAHIFVLKTFAHYHDIIYPYFSIVSIDVYTKLVVFTFSFLFLFIFICVLLLKLRNKSRVIFKKTTPLLLE